jgi:two-component system LytT family response regulator
MSYNFLIVDDERLSRSYIRKLILEYEESAVVHEARSAGEAQSLLRDHPIDILFLDIQMPEMNGFELLDTLENRNFDLVFITAYSQYAITAIRQGAFDYILKPINKREFGEMLIRLINVRKNRTPIPSAEQEQLSAGKDYKDQKIAIYHQKGVQYVPISEIVYLKALNTYTLIYNVSGEKIIVSKSMSRFEQGLDTRWFFRTHKSYIINMNHFSAYRSENGNNVVMNNGAVIPVSRHRLKAFREIIKNYHGTINL